MSTESKIYVGSGKKKFDNLRSVSICLSDLNEHVFEYNGKKYLKLNVHDKKEADQYGKDIAVSIDTWKPEEKTIQSSSEKMGNGLPF